MISQDFRLGSWRVRPDTHELEGPEGATQLKPRTMEVLLHLARHAGEVRTREEVLAEIWGDAFVGEEVLTHCIWELRLALGDQERKKRFIRTIHGKGYQLIAPVAWIDPVDAPRLMAPEEDRQGRQGDVERPEGEALAVLRGWPAPELPNEPYPVLLPYTHPALLAGREREIAELRLLLRRPIPILGLSAPSGTGKSSLLLGGLVPELRADPNAPPVALLRHPQEADLVRRLLNGLLEGGQPAPRDEDWAGFVERLEEVGRLAGAAPILVLDQFEEILLPSAVRARRVLGPLLAASVRRRPGSSAPLCHWLLAYRQEFLGELSVWLRDVLSDARAGKVSGVESLPHDLGDPQRFHSKTLLPLATPPSGGDALAEATRVFTAAISKPLAVEVDGERRYPWQFAPGHAERLALTFAEARLEQPDAPLGPELQVTLGHLLAQAGTDGLVEVGDTSHLLDHALEDHLRRALAATFPDGERDTAVRRARALLALRELTDAPPGDGLPVAELTRALGEDGERVITELATPRTRLVVFRDAPEGMRCVLSHARMAEAVVHLVEEEGRRGRLLLDAELLALRRFVALKTSHHRLREAQATRLPRRHYQRIAAHSEALLWDDERRAWWSACRKRRRTDRLRLWTLAAAVVALLLGVAGGVAHWTRKSQEAQSLWEMLAHGAPPVALMAFDRLAAEGETDPAELLSLLRQREDPQILLELSPPGLAGDDESRWLLRFVEALLPWVEETPQDAVLTANLVQRLDFLQAQDPRLLLAARNLREKVLAPLRREHPPPAGEADCVEIPGGQLVAVPIPDNFRQEVTVESMCMLTHEVTFGELRRLMPETHPEWSDDFPASGTWYEAYTYAAWLGGRLPTEAEWLHAGRAGCAAAYCRENGEEATLSEVAWWIGNSRTTETGEPSAQPVMRLAPNPWGLYDMVGNVSEWSAERVAPGIRSARGGNAFYASWASEVEAREWFDSMVSYNGFRVVFPNPSILPRVALLAPASGSTLPSGRDVTLAADAFDVDGVISSVRFSAVRGRSEAELLGEASAAPYTTTWKDVADGCYVVRAEAVDDGGKTATAVADVTVGSCAQRPYYEDPVAIPGTVRAADFDLGLNGEAYFDDTPGNAGGAYRHTDVDLQLSYDFGGGYYVGWTGAGEWIEYTVDVAAAGDYDLYARVASLETGGTFHVAFAGVDRTGPMTVPVTGEWQEWETISATVRLDAGVQVMRWQNTAAADNGYNLGEFTIVAAGSSFCGDGVCEPGESCVSCPVDCDGLRHGRPRELFCCGNGVAEPTEGDGSRCDGNP